MDELLRFIRSSIRLWFWVVMTVAVVAIIVRSAVEVWKLVVG